MKTFIIYFISFFIFLPQCLFSQTNVKEVARVETSNECLNQSEIYSNLISKTGSWKVENGYLLQTDKNAAYASTYISDHQWVDCKVTAKIKVTSCANVPESGFSIIVRANDSLDTFIAVNLLVSSNRVSIEKSNGLNFTKLKKGYIGGIASVDYKFEKNRDYKLTVIVDRATVYCIINDKFVVLGQEPDFCGFPMGKVGFLSNYATGTITDVSITGLYQASKELFIPYSGNPLNISVYSPTVIKDNGGYLMYWASLLGNVEPIVGFGAATSKNGIEWVMPTTKFTRNLDPIFKLPEKGKAGDIFALGDPDILKVGDEYKLFSWLLSSRRNGAFDGMGLYCGRDPRNLEIFGSNPTFYMGPKGSWDEFVVGDHSWIKDGDTYKLWFVGINRGEHGYRNEFGYAESKDGINWKKCRLNPVLTMGETGDWDGGWIYAASVVKLGDEETQTRVYKGGKGVYHLFYTGQPTNDESITGVKRIGYAFSLDGINWVKYDDPSTSEVPFVHSDPIFPWPAYGKCGSLGVGACTALKDGDEIKIYFTGYGERQTGTTGLASIKISKLNDIVEKARKSGKLKEYSEKQTQLLLYNPHPLGMWDDMQNFLLDAVTDKNKSDDYLLKYKTILSEFPDSQTKFYIEEMSKMKSLADYLLSGGQTDIKCIKSIDTFAPANDFFVSNMEFGEVIDGIQHFSVVGANPKLIIKNLSLDISDGWFLIKIEMASDKYNDAIIDWFYDESTTASGSKSFFLHTESGICRYIIMPEWQKGKNIAQLGINFPDSAKIQFKSLKIYHVKKHEKEGIK